MLADRHLVPWTFRIAADKSIGLITHIMLEIRRRIKAFPVFVGFEMIFKKMPSVPNLSFDHLFKFKDYNTKAYHEGMLLTNA